MAVGYLEEMAAQGYSPESIGSFHLTMVPCLLAMLSIGKNETVVDVGAAQGHVAISLRRAGFSDVHAVDIEPTNFPLFSAEHQISCHRCDVAADPLPFRSSTVSALVTFHLIEHLPRGDHFLSEAYRVIRPNGSIAIVTPDWRKQYKTFYRDPTHIHPYDKVSLPRLLRSAGFRDIRTFSWGSKYGLGRLRLYSIFPRLAMVGSDMLIVGIKPGSPEEKTAQADPL